MGVNIETARVVTIVDTNSTQTRECQKIVEMEKAWQDR